MIRLKCLRVAFLAYCYLCYVNDNALNEVHCILFADDINISIKHEDSKGRYKTHANFLLCLIGWLFTYIKIKNLVVFLERESKHLGGIWGCFLEIVLYMPIDIQYIKVHCLYSLIMLKYNACFYNEMLFQNISWTSSFWISVSYFAL